MAAMLREIEQYWARRADSYSELVNQELGNDSEARWMRAMLPRLPKAAGAKVLDIGTGPGFFAIALARRGYDVTAVDYTPEMLDRARANAGGLAERIEFRRMDAHSLDFPDARFDAIVTRNLTWNLERPADAYAEWRRVLKPGGVLLNFDAGWYNYLFDEEKGAGYARDRRNVAEEQVFDFESYPESHVMEDISRRLVMSRAQRPQADLRMLEAAGFSSAEADTGIWRQIWDEVEKLNYASSPMFMLRAVK